jgi:Zn-dependent M28 family amino/carboxypeptidase
MKVLVPWAVGIIAMTTLSVTPAHAVPDPDSSRLREAVTVDAVFGHMQALDDIAAANDGERAAGTPGYEASVKYVTDLLGDAGYRITVQPFDFPFFDVLGPSEFEQISPEPTTYVADVDFGTMVYSGSGDTTAPLEAVNVTIPPPALPGATSGCSADDFAGFTSGNVALIQRGSCSFATKATNAENAGASAVIVFNEGQPGRDGLFFGTLGGPGVEIPVLSTSFELGNALYQSTLSGETVVRVATDTISEIRETSNVFAETRGGKPQSVMMYGAHLDSVLDSPGMNDNASGTAALLETAIQMSELGIAPRNRVRFAFWGAEELGLLGSDYYVTTLSDAEKDRIRMYLNFDVIGSINGFPFVFAPQAGDGTRPESAEATEVFSDHFTDVGLPFAETPLVSGSDHLSFIVGGIPAGGLFSGATGIKTEEQAAAYGGTADEPYDALINSPLDTIDRINIDVLDDMTQAAVHGMYWYAFRTPAQDRARTRPAATPSELSTVPAR